MAWGIIHLSLSPYLLPVLGAGGTSDNLVSVVPDGGVTDLRDEVDYG